MDKRPLPADASIDALIEDLLRTSAPETFVSSDCWSLQLCGGDHPCVAGFQAGLGHFKNHFCERCRLHGIVVAADRVCLMTPALKGLFSNANGRTVWTNGARIINQTAKCSGPAGLLFQGAVPKAMADLAAPVPDSWLCSDQPSFGAPCIRLIISKGTLVPVTSVPAVLRRHSQHRPSTHGMHRSEPAPKRAREEFQSSTRLISLSATSDIDGSACSMPSIEALGSDVVADGWPDCMSSCVPPTQVCEAGDTLQSESSLSPSPYEMWIPCDRRSLLAAHTALALQIEAALKNTHSRVWAAPNDVESCSEAAWDRHLDELSTLATAEEMATVPLTVEEVKTLCHLQYLLHASSALLQASIQGAVDCGVGQPMNQVSTAAMHASTLHASTLPAARSKELPISAPGYHCWTFAPPPPSSAGTLPPSPPSSRPATASTRACGSGEAMAAQDTHASSKSRGAKTCAVGTQTPMRIDPLRLSLLVSLAVGIGMASAASGGAAASLALNPSMAFSFEGAPPPWLISVIAAAVSAICFNLGIGLFVLLMRKFGLLDHRTVRILSSTWFGRTYWRCCFSRRDHYRIMDPETALLYEADLRANQRGLKCLSCFLALLAILFCTFGFIVSPLLWPPVGGLQDVGHLNVSSAAVSTTTKVCSC